MRRSRESIENLGQKKEEEESVIKKLERIKKREEEIAQEDKTGTPWHAINPKDLIPEAQELFDSFEKGEYETAQELLKAVREKTKDMKKPDVKGSNEEFANLLDNQIVEGIAQRELKEEQEKDNY